MYFRRAQEGRIRYRRGNASVGIEVWIVSRGTHHRNPDMDPPTRQELMHDRPLRREHIGVLLAVLRIALLGRQARAMDDGLPGGRGAGRVHDALGVGGRAELVWLAEGSVLAILGGLCGWPGRSEAAAGGVDAVFLLLEGLQGAGCWKPSWKEEWRDWSRRHNFQVFPCPFFFFFFCVVVGS